MRVDYQKFVDQRGYLGVIEAARDAGFPIERVYWLTGLASDLPRGFHAHKVTRQLAVCLEGSCRILLQQANGEEEWVECKAGGPALRIEPMVWHEMHDFSVDCVLLVLADRSYDEADYIRNRAEWEAVPDA